MPSPGLVRVIGLDVARGIALLGMFASHVGDADARTGWPWLIAFHGRSAALFAVLAGVSMALMLARQAARAHVPPADRDAVRHTRIRITVRAALLIPLGWALSALDTPVDVILDNLGVMMLIALIALRWRAGAMAATGVGYLLLGTLLVDGVRSVVPEWLYRVPVIHELWSPHYPALSWIGYVLLGMALGSWRPWRGRPLVVLGIGGLVVGLALFALGWALGGEPAWTAVDPHAYSPVEMLSNTGVAAAVIAVCLLLTRVARPVVWPLAAAGAMTLTLYSAHIVVIAIVGAEMVWIPTNTAMLVLCAATLAVASAWRALLGQGPLERLLTWASTRTADADARRRSRRPPATMAA